MGGENFLYLIIGAFILAIVISGGFGFFLKHKFGIDNWATKDEFETTIGDYIIGAVMFFISLIISFPIMAVVIKYFF